MCRELKGDKTELVVGTTIQNSLKCLEFWFCGWLGDSQHVFLSREVAEQLCQFSRGKWIKEQERSEGRTPRGP